MKNNEEKLPLLTKEDFKSQQSVRWCPGCGDYAILSAVQRTLAALGLKRENTVFVSGIGCSSRFPYYMSTYGFHTIHGRAPCVATGIKIAQPNLNVWIISGDGDSLSIGTNHFVHLIRRDVDVNYLIFNNRIYGLTKGQYSPTSEKGKVTRSSPRGTSDQPLNPLALALASGATFIGRCLDRNLKHLCNVLEAATMHRGTSIIEIYQNCNIFNDGTFDSFSHPEKKRDHALYLEKNKPLIYGGTEKKALFWGKERKIIDKPWDSEQNISKDILNAPLTHDPQNREMAQIYTEMGESGRIHHLPTPFGILYQKENRKKDLKNDEKQSLTSESNHLNLDDDAIRRKKLLNLQKKIQQNQTWEM